MLRIAISCLLLLTSTDVDARENVHWGVFSAVAPAPGGFQLARSRQDGAIDIGRYDSAGRLRGELVLRLEGHHLQSYGLVVDGDGRFWVHAMPEDDGRSRRTAVFSSKGEPLRVFPPDLSMTFAVGSDGRVIGWRLTDDDRLRIVRLSSEGTGRLLFTLDRDEFGGEPPSCSGERIFVVPTGGDLWLLRKRGGHLYALRYSESGARHGLWRLPPGEDDYRAASPLGDDGLTVGALQAFDATGPTWAKPLADQFHMNYRTAGDDSGVLVLVEGRRVFRFNESGEERYSVDLGPLGSHGSLADWQTLRDRAREAAENDSGDPDLLLAAVLSDVPEAAEARKRLLSRPTDATEALARRLRATDDYSTVASELLDELAASAPETVLPVLDAHLDLEAPTLTTQFANALIEHDPHPSTRLISLLEEALLRRDEEEMDDLVYLARRAFFQSPDQRRHALAPPAVRFPPSARLVKLYLDCLGDAECRDRSVVGSDLPDFLVHHFHAVAPTFRAALADPDAPLHRPVREILPEIVEDLADVDENTGPAAEAFAAFELSGAVDARPAEVITTARQEPKASHAPSPRATESATGNPTLDTVQLAGAIRRRDQSRPPPPEDLERWTQKLEQAPGVWGAILRSSLLSLAAQHGAWPSLSAAISESYGNRVFGVDSMTLSQLDSVYGTEAVNDLILHGRPLTPTTTSAPD